MNPDNQFSKGVVSMARNCKCALVLIKHNTWTIEQADLWLDAVINNDGTEAIPKAHEIIQAKI